MARDKLPPCFFDANGDVVISMLTTMSPADAETTDLRISGQRLRAVSPYFEANLKPEWLHNKITGQGICSNGQTLIMKRFELELDSDGGDFLVGKTATTNPELRVTAAQSIKRLLHAENRRSLLQPSVKREYDMLFCHLNLEQISTVNLLGFSMICGFPVETDRLLLDRHEEMHYEGIHSHLVTRIVLGLLDWIHYYGTLEGTQARLAQFIRSEVSPIAIQKFTLLYLRIACVLRDKSLFNWILDKNPLFSNNICLSMSSIDCRLGIGLWASAFERHLNFLGSVLRKLRNLPDRIPPFIQDRFTAEEWKLILYVWNSWLVDLAAEKRAKYQNVDPSILALHSIATSDFIFPLHSFQYTPLVAQHANRYLQHALIQARDDTSQHMTIDESEPLGFRINNDDFLLKYGYPWDYRVEEDTDEELFMLIATNSLVTRNEDLRSDQKEVSNPIIHGF
ncbi:hypothetical protein KCU64_g9769, partial [Aureobasidium melanogenum]